MSSVTVPCFCGEKHKFNDVTYKFGRYNLYKPTQAHPGRGELWVKLADCKRCGDTYSIIVKTYAKGDCADYDESQEPICKSCRPFIRKVRIDKYDGAKPGTQLLLEGLANLNTKLNTIQTRLTDLEEKMDKVLAQTQKTPAANTNTPAANTNAPDENN